MVNVCISIFEIPHNLTLNRQNGDVFQHHFWCCHSESETDVSISPQALKEGLLWDGLLEYIEKTVSAIFSSCYEPLWVFIQHQFKWLSECYCCKYWFVECWELYWGSSFLHINDFITSINLPHPAATVSSRKVQRWGWQAMASLNNRSMEMLFICSLKHRKSL